MYLNIYKNILIKNPACSGMYIYMHVYMTLYMCVYMNMYMFV